MLNLNLPGDGGGGGLVSKSCTTLSTPRTVVLQASLSTGFPRQENWRGLLFPSPGDLSNPGVEPGSPALQVDSLLTEPPGKPYLDILPFKKYWLLSSSKKNNLKHLFLV